jgi:uncharacterized protein YegP (UPF0339 family)
MKQPRFEIFIGKNDQFYFRLKARNGRIILQSEGYTARHNCKGGIAALRTNVLFSTAFEVFEGNRNYYLYEVWLFRVVAPNGEIISMSETYKTKSSARKGIASVRKNAPIAIVVDLTK